MVLRSAAAAALVISAAVATGLGASTGSPADAARAQDPSGRWPLQPVPATVVAGFHPPATDWGRGHRGVDLLGQPGQQVLAALPGQVSYAGPLAGVGVVVVDHGPTRTTYQPVVAGLPVGAAVAAGDPVGALALFGSHCLPRACLHWGWRRGEVYLDPLRLVGGGPVRLLPLDGWWAPSPADLPTTQSRSRFAPQCRPGRQARGCA